MKSNDYKSSNIPLTNELISSARGAHRKYTGDLLNRKKKELLQEKVKKKKSINENIMTLNQRKTLLENTITEMIKDSDRLAFKAEIKSKFELLSKSNVLKRAANEKQAELDQCLKEKEIARNKNTSVMFKIILRKFKCLHFVSKYIYTFFCEESDP